jgi:hypothetical protein
MIARSRLLVPLALLTAAVMGSVGSDDPQGELLGGSGPAGSSGGEEGPAAALAAKLVAGPPMVRNISNRELLSAVSDLIGEPLPADLQKTWTATTQFSGFDAVPWTSLDTKAVRDLSETLELMLDRAVASPKVMTCTATVADDLPYAKCAQAIVEPFAKRAYVRPLAAAEKDLLAKRYEDGIALAKTALEDPKAIFVDGVRTALGSILLAPQFVTRIEAPPPPDFAGERDLDAYELASRLSFMFLGTIPDDELWSKAESGELASDGAVLRAQVERLIDTKTDVFVKSFMGQWFDFRAYATSAPGTLESAMYEESWRVMADIVREGLPASAIVKPGFTYLNKDLAAHYSVVGQFPAELTRVQTDERGGVLQQGSWLSASATALKTSAIHRGRLVQDRLVCKVVPPPDSALFEKIQMVSQSIPQTATVKERLAAHRNAGEACFGCHEYMDPIGLGLEGFDQRGRLRNAYAETGKPVETDSNFLGAPFAKFSELNQMIADLPDYQRCAAEKLTVYSTRRVLDAKSTADADVLAYLTHPEGDKPPSMRAMIVRLVTSKTFRKVNHGAAK